MPSPFDTYLAKIQNDLRGGKATEHTYRSSLEQLLESLASGVDASNDPKHIQAGAPDFIVERNHVPLGYVETKDVGADLDAIEKSEQLKRYRASLHNLILTDYLEFRWYVNGAPRLTARLASIGKAKKLIPDPQGIEQVARLLDAFYKTETPIVGTSKELAERMAKLTHIVRELIVGWLNEESASGVFHRQFKAFQQNLLPNLKEDEFADIYAQTMAYGLFAARVNLPAGKIFSRAEASLYLPKANPFLRKLFRDVGEELDDTPVAHFLDDLAHLLNRAHIDEILADFSKRTHDEDAVVHFYETFLAAYDPKLRKTRGVFYTPEPVVSFIVRSVDHLLKTEFNRPRGLADPNTYLLDPATGTATFLYFVIRAIHDAQTARGQAGAWQEYVRDSLLKRVFGFELLMAPYTVAHLKLGLLLNELGYAFGKDERLGVYLTNTLEEAVTRAETLGLAGYLSEEGAEAAVVRNKQPIMVVLGNPPYSGHSANKGNKWIENRVRDYYFVDGKPLGERNPKWLQDDYVKFIRFAQWRIEQTGQGIVGFITNHGYLDNPTFRGMRQNLLATFDEIYVLDLHGNSKKREVAPDGGKDENVFDIQQGVAILLAVKTLTPTLSQKEREFPPLPEGEGRGEGKIKLPLPPAFLARVRELRQNATDAEKLLWSLLRNRQLGGMKFRRQHPVPPYILDFYCHEVKLAVELDGGGHAEPEQAKRDAKRTDDLNAQGIRVIRFWNNEVLQHTQEVLEQIWNSLTPARSQGEREQDSPRPAGEGQGVRAHARVHHAHLWGARANKYKALSDADVASVRWEKLLPTAPFYLFVPQDTGLREEYERGWKITDAMPLNNIAMQTHRDYFVTDFDAKELHSRIAKFRDTRLSDDEAKRDFDLENLDVAKARKKLRDDKDWQKKFVQCLWRPFDFRPLFYHRDLIDRPRPQVTEVLLEPNRALLAMRQIALHEGCSHFLVTDIPPVDRVFYSDKGAASVFPLYLYTTPDATAGTLFAQTETTRVANLAPAFVTALEEKLGMRFVADGRDVQLNVPTLTPESIFNYIYAVFHCPTYRTRYAEFLKIDFPRVPLTSDKKLFTKLAAKGAELVALHLMKSPALDDFITTFSVTGSNAVEKVEYANKRVWFNKEQYFGGVPENVWEFRVGGYQVCEKWLKDRKGRTLNGDDITHYQRVVVALKETRRVMKEIDAAITKWPLE